MRPGTSDQVSTGVMCGPTPPPLSMCAHPADYKRQGLWPPFPLDPRTNHGLLDSGVSANAE